MWEFLFEHWFFSLLFVFLWTGSLLLVVDLIKIHLHRWFIVGNPERRSPGSIEHRVTLNINLDDIKKLKSFWGNTIS